MITATQAAAILGMSARFVYGLGDRGEVVKYQLNRRTLNERASNNPLLHRQWSVEV